VISIVCFTDLQCMTRICPHSHITPNFKHYKNGVTDPSSWAKLITQHLEMLCLSNRLRSFQKSLMFNYTDGISFANMQNSTICRHWFYCMRNKIL